MCSNEEPLRANDISLPPQRDMSTQQITDKLSLRAQTYPTLVVKKQRVKKQMWRHVCCCSDWTFLTFRYGRNSTGRLLALRMPVRTNWLHSMINSFHLKSTDTFQPQFCQEKANIAQETVSLTWAMQPVWYLLSDGTFFSHVSILICFAFPGIPGTTLLQGEWSTIDVSHTFLKYKCLF